MKDETKELIKLLIKIEDYTYHSIRVENWDRVAQLKIQAERIKEELTLLALIK